MILNLRVSARMNTEQLTTTGVATCTGARASEWDTMPRFADGSGSFELSTVGQSSDGTRTYVEGADKA